MFYYIYQITNNLNNHFYIGRRSSKVEPLIDPYFGSGLGLKAAILKYGKENFTKTILHIVDTFDELVDLEKQIVNESLVTRPDCYNQALGGFGGGLILEETRIKLKHSLLDAWRNNQQRRKLHASDCRCRLSKFWVGKVRNETDRQNKSASALKLISQGKHAFQTQVTCPYCSTTCDIGNAKKWHFSNCKQNPDYQPKVKISRKIVTPSGTYSNVKKAADASLITQQTVLNRCFSANFPDWYIINETLEK